MFTGAKIRTNNMLERDLREVRRRTKPMGLRKDVMPISITIKTFLVKACLISGKAPVAYLELLVILNGR